MPGTAGAGRGGAAAGGFAGVAEGGRAGAVFYADGGEGGACMCSASVWSEVLQYNVFPLDCFCGESDCDTWEELSPDPYFHWEEHCGIVSIYSGDCWTAWNRYFDAQTHELVGLLRFSDVVDGSCYEGGYEVGEIASDCPGQPSALVSATVYDRAEATGGAGGAGGALVAELRVGQPASDDPDGINRTIVNGEDNAVVTCTRNDGSLEATVNVSAAAFSMTATSTGMENYEENYEGTATIRATTDQGTFESGEFTPCRALVQFVDDCAFPGLSGMYEVALDCTDVTADGEYEPQYAIRGRAQFRCDG